MPEAAKEHGIHGVDIGGDELAVSGVFPSPEADSAGYGGDGHRNPPATAEEAADDGNGDNYDIRSRSIIPVASKRDVQIVPEPAGKRHVPAAPELLGVHSLVWRVEVLGQVEAHEHGYAGCYVRVAGEIGIDLQGIAEKGCKVFKAAEHEGIGKDAVGKVHGHVVGQDELFEKTVHYPEDGDAEPAAGQVVRLVKLGYELRRTDDGACHQLREETQVETEVQEILHRLYLAAFYVHDIAHRLEGKERYTYRQDDGVYAEDCRTGEHVKEFTQNIMDLYRQPEEVVQEVGEEVCILEICQEPEVYKCA